METVSGALVERVAGGQASRFKSLLAATAIGFTAATLTYRLLRRGAPSGDGGTGSDER